MSVRFLAFCAYKHKKAGIIRALDSEKCINIFKMHGCTNNSVVDSLSFSLFLSLPLSLYINIYIYIIYIYICVCVCVCVCVCGRM